jgi:hypothetical protein
MIDSKLPPGIPSTTKAIIDAKALAMRTTMFVDKDQPEPVPVA